MLFRVILKSHKEVHVDSWKISFPCLDRTEVNLLEIPFAEKSIGN